jgi:hypothetical protein
MWPRSRSMPGCSARVSGSVTAFRSASLLSTPLIQTLTWRPTAQISMRFQLPAGFSAPRFTGETL